MSQKGLLWKWFKDNGFNIQTPLLIFDDSFKAYGINYSLLLKRAFFIINSLNDDIISAFREANLTFFGERHQFPVEFFKKINSLNNPVSIITANDISSLVHFLINTLQNIYITIKTPFLENFLTEPEDGEQALEVIEKLKKSDALFFNTHGDILCASLKYAILCAKDEKSLLEKNCKLPVCAASGQCFRKNRFKNKDSFRLIRLEDLQAKVIFLNTCAGFSLTNTKFDEYPNLLPLKAIENNTVVYISSYLIKYSTIEEIFLFWALLNKYRNFSLATFYFNKVSSSFLGEEKLIMMLGDGMINLESNDDINYHWAVIYSQKNEIVIRVTDIRTSSLFFSLEMNMHKLFTSCKLKNISAFIDKPYVCSIGSCIDNDNIKINFIIQFHNNFPETIHVHLSPKSIIRSKIKTIEKKANLLNVYMSITIDQSFKDNLQLLSSGIQELFGLLRSTANQSDLNGTKYLYMHLISQKLHNKVSDFEDVFLDAVINRSLNSDTHLILDEGNLLKQKNVSLTGSNCYICGSNLYEMSYNYKAGHSVTFIQSICPQCEIISVRNNQIGILRIFSPVSIERDSDINLRLVYQTKQKNTSTVKIGIALINGMVSIIENGLSFRENLEYSATVKIPESLTTGLFYWRCILLYEGKVTISHKQVCICGENDNKGLSSD